MTNSEFMNILNDDSLELTVEELENIIEEELQKDDSEMDPDLIEYCLYYISKAETEGGKEKKADSAGNDKITEPPAADKLKKSRFNGKLKNLLIIAATIALLLVTTGIATVATNKKVKNALSLSMRITYRFFLTSKKKKAEYPERRLPQSSKSTIFQT